MLRPFCEQGNFLCFLLNRSACPSMIVQRKVLSLPRIEFCLSVTIQTAASVLKLDIFKAPWELEVKVQVMFFIIPLIPFTRSIVLASTTERCRDYKINFPEAALIVCNSAASHTNTWQTQPSIRRNISASLPTQSCLWVHACSSQRQVDWYSCEYWLYALNWKLLNF